MSKKVEYYYIFASTENINNMKDLVKEEKQTCKILHLEFGLKKAARYKFDLVNYYFNFNC